MQRILIIVLIALVLYGCASIQKTAKQNQKMNQHIMTYLALGDSYTIGEGVALEERYPNQAVAILKEKGVIFSDPKTIAKTGWTTDELAKGIEAAEIDGNTYDMVTLLIGVNNQYRGRPIENYKLEFKSMLQQAITFAKGDEKHVVVLSIPDWGVTPFASERGSDQAKVAREIDEYNKAKKEICNQLGVVYIDITEHYRVYGMKPEGVVADKLHPSGWIYMHWAEQLVEVIGRMEF